MDSVRMESVCIFSSIKRMLEKFYPSINESDIQMLGFGIVFDNKLSREGVITIDISFEEIFAKIDGFLGSKSVIKKYTDVNDFHRDVREKIGNGKAALLYLSTAKLTYHDVYKNNPASMHCITLYDITEGECYIYDSHIRVGHSFTEYEGYIPLRQIFDTIDKVIYFETPPCNKFDRNRIFQHYESLYKNKRSIDLACNCYKEHLMKVINMICTSTEIAEVCTKLFFELNVFGPKHILSNLLSFLKNLNINFPVKSLNELDDIINEYESFKNVICKTGITCNSELFKSNINKYLEIPDRISCVLSNIFNSN